MRAITFQGIEQLAYESVPDPAIEAPTDVLIEVELAGICGSDLHPYFGRETGIDLGTVMGHEYLGRVIETGSEIENFSPGDRVVGPFTTNCGRCYYCELGLTCRCEQGQLFGWREQGVGLQGSQAEMMRVPLADSTLARVGEDLPGEQVLFVGDILATGFYCAELAEVEEGDTAVVIGCGPVGLMAVLGARELGAGTILALDTLPDRLQLAENFGARGINVSEVDPVEAVLEATAGRGADRILEAVGSPQATRLGVDLVRPGGTLAAIGVHTEPQFAFAPGEAYDKNLSYRAGRCPVRRYTERLLEIVAGGRYDLSAIVSHHLPLSQGVEGYRMFADRTDGCTKIILAP
jgi:2-desacetyl-2-hydroxyethyl bacteriochlorophyllide A dehydrogenase